MKKILAGIMASLISVCAWAAEPVNINTASAEEISENLKGIGPSKAEAIVAYREANGAFDHVERPDDFTNEVFVTRRIDNVDAVLVVLLVHALPEACRGSRRNRDAALLFLLHPVHHGGTVMHLADFVRDTCVEQDALRSGRLPGIDVGHDADVPIALDWRRACHDQYLR